MGPHSAVSGALILWCSIAAKDPSRWTLQNPRDARWCCAWPPAVTSCSKTFAGAKRRRWGWMKWRFARASLTSYLRFALRLWPRRTRLHQARVRRSAAGAHRHHERHGNWRGTSHAHRRLHSGCDHRHLDGARHSGRVAGAQAIRERPARGCLVISNRHPVYGLPSRLPAVLGR